MTFHMIHVIPGLTSGDLATAKRALEDGLEDAGLRPLTPADVRRVADGMLAAFPHYKILGDDEPDRGSEGPPEALSLFPILANSGPDVEVGSEGVAVCLMGDMSPAENDADVPKALALAKGAARLVSGAVFDPRLGRFLDADAPSDRAALLEAGRASWAAPGRATAYGRPPRVVLLMPMIGFLIAAIFQTRTKWALLALPLGLVLAIVLSRRALRRMAGSGPDGGPGAPPSAPPAGFGGGAISPR